MRVILKVLLLGALLAGIPDTSHGLYTKCGTNGYCVPTIYPICEGIAGLSDCKADEHCCMDRKGVNRPATTTEAYEQRVPPWMTHNPNHGHYPHNQFFPPYIVG